VQSELMQATEYAQVRRAYEWGRLRTSLRRALLVFAPVAVVACLVTGRTALAWLPVTLAAWVIAHWRGGALLRGAFFGLAGGAITYALPMSVLRPYCSPEMMAAGGDCCTNPGACLAAGGLVGLVLAAFLPAGSARWQTSGGMALGVASVAILRCSTLFAGETVGLLGGLLAGVLAATMVRLVLGVRSVRRT
jgi:hypothetical protein